MNQHSEDRLPEAEPTAQERATARILQFERPQSDLQRAIQQRAQEALDIERDRDREANKPAPLKWTIILLIAMIPVVLIFGAVDSFLRVFHKVNEMNSAAPPPAAVAPAEPEASQPQSSTPGLVILQPYEESADGQGAARSAPPDAQTPPDQRAPRPQQ